MHTLLKILAIASPFLSSAANTTWREIGQGLPVAAIGASTLIADPADASTIYAITKSFQLFKSTDGSGNWKALSGITGVFSFLIDPRNSATLYAGTSHGVLKSTDGGTSWTAANAGLQRGGPSLAYLLAIDPLNSSVLYVQELNGVFKTGDGGQSWNALTLPLANAGIQKLVIDPHDSTMYALVSGMSLALLKSTDAGATWYVVSVPGANQQSGTLAFDQATSTLYLAWFEFDYTVSHTTKLHITRTTDQGATWTPADTGFPGGLVYNIDLAIDPQGTGTVYALYKQFSTSGETDTRFAKGADRGESWSAINTGLPANYPFTSIALATNSVLYASFSYYAGLGGIFKSTDGGENWRGANAGPAVADVTSVAVDPLDSDVVYAGTRGNGVYKSVDRGANWSISGALVFPPYLFALSQVAILSLVIDPANSNTLYAWSNSPCAASDGLLFKSTDGGANWNGNFIPPPNQCSTGGFLVMDPSDSNTLYVAESNGPDIESWLRKTTDGGMSWNYVWQSDDDYLQALVIDPATPTTIYLGTSNGLAKTADGGATWNNTGLQASVNFLAIDSSHPNVLYAATSSNGDAGLFRSTDAGANWSPINTGLETLNDAGSPVTALMADPANSGVIFAGTSGSGVFRSTDAGEHWTPFSDGLTNLDVRALATSKGHPALLCASTSGGVFAIALAASPR